MFSGWGNLESQGRASHPQSLMGCPCSPPWPLRGQARVPRVTAPVPAPVASVPAHPSVALLPPGHPQAPHRSLSGHSPFHPLLFPLTLEPLSMQNHPMPSVLGALALAGERLVNSRQESCCGGKEMLPLFLP